MSPTSPATAPVTDPALAPEARFVLAAEALDEGLALLEGDGRVVVANARWYELHEAVTGGRIGADSTLGGWIGEQRPRHARERKALEAYRKHLRRRDGSPLTLPWGEGRWLLTRFAPLADGGTLALARDVTDERARERELQDAVERFRAYAESSGDWLWELDADLRYTFASESARESGRGKMARLVGTGFLDRLHKLAVDPSQVTAVARSLEAREPFRELEVRLRDADGEERVTSLSAVPFTGPDGRFSGFRGIGRNVTEARELASRLAYQANHDDLTGLANRRALEARVARLLSERGEHGGEHALCVLDLDQIRVINDTCGHVAGDAAINRIAKMLGKGLRGADTVARLGGDEFGVLLRDRDSRRAQALAEKIRVAIQDRPFVWEGRQFRLTASIGVAPLGDDMSSAADVMRAADSACHAAKEGGRNRVKRYALDDSTLNLRQGEMHWVARIHAALAEHRFELFGQPIAPTRPGDDPYLHFEALLRLNGRDGRCFEPGAFMPAAERYNLASQIDSWALDEALAWLERSPLFFDHLHLLSINLSGQSLGEPAFRSHVRDRIRRHERLAEKLCFEITETAAIAHLEPVQEFMRSMREFGCSFALDDFGAGLSSFAYLRTLKVDYLKIDGMFVKDLDDDPVHFAMVRSINEVGHVMGKKTIAEFVENERIREKLAEIGVDMVQGYGIGKPVPLSELA